MQHEKNTPNQNKCPIENNTSNVKTQTPHNHFISTIRKKYKQLKKTTINTSNQNANTKEKRFKQKNTPNQNKCPQPNDNEPI